MPDHEITCPGCGLLMPAAANASYDGYYNTSPECWSVYAELLGAEFSNAVVFGQVHQLTVDAYAVQHAGGPHPDKSVTVHLVGLRLALEVGIKSPYIPRQLQRLAAAIDVWPHFAPPDERAPMTVFDVAMAATPIEHVELSRAWAAGVWESWSGVHGEVAALAARHLGFEG